MAESKGHWADPGRPGYRVQQKPVGKDRINTEKIPTNDDFPQSWLPVRGRALCAADVKEYECHLETLRNVKNMSTSEKSMVVVGSGATKTAGDVVTFDPAKRRLKTMPTPKQKTPQQPELAEEDPYDVLLMGVDYALKDLAAARDAAYASGEDTLGARINKAVEQAYMTIMGRGEE